VEAYQAFGTADLGLVAYETPAREGMVVNEDLILEIVRPGTGDPGGICRRRLFNGGR
jgi:phenylacetate-CoA ligase